MDFRLTEEQELLIKTVRSLMEEQCDEATMSRLDDQGEFPWHVIRACADLDLLGLSIPEAYGGTDADVLTQALVIEEMAKYSTAASFAFMIAVMFGGAIISKYGSEQQKQELLPLMLKGECLVALGLTEPGAGSDAAAVATTAVRDGDEFVINGTKTFCTLAGLAKYILCICITDKDVVPYKGMSIILVPTDAAGIRMAPLKKVGMHSIPTFEVYLDNVRVPAANLLGELNRGWSQLVGILDKERLLASAAAVGMAEAAFSDAATYANQRVQFKQPVANFQAIQHKIADMRMAIDACRLLAYRCAWMLDSNQPIRHEAAIAKTAATEACFKVADEAMQIMGGVGYMMASRVQRIWRDGRLMRIAAGTNEVQRNIIGQTVLAAYK